MEWFTLGAVPAAVAEPLPLTCTCPLLFFELGLEGELQAEKDSKAIGTTRRGIGPCYASKANRNGIRFADLLNEVIDAAYLSSCQPQQGEPTLRFMRGVGCLEKS